MGAANSVYFPRLFIANKTDGNWQIGFETRMSKVGATVIKSHHLRGSRRIRKCGNNKFFFVLRICSSIAEGVFFWEGNKLISRRIDQKRRICAMATKTIRRMRERERIVVGAKSHEKDVRRHRQSKSTFVIKALTVLNWKRGNEKLN